MNERLLKDVKKSLLIKYPQFGGELAKMNFEYNSNLPCKTAATNGDTIFIDPDYFESLSSDDRLFLIAHEFMHVKFEHMYRLADKDGNLRDMKIWNIATDAIINANLERDGLKIKEGYVNMPDALNYNAEDYYDLLIKKRDEERKNKNNQSSNKNNQNNSSQGESKEKENSSNENQDNNKQNQDNSDNQENNKNQNNDDNNNQKADKNKGEDSLDDDKTYSDHSMWEDAFKNQQENDKEANEKEDNQDLNNKGKQKEKDKNKKEQNEKDKSKKDGEKDLDKEESFEQKKKEKQNQRKNNNQSKNNSNQMDEFQEFANNRKMKQEMAKQYFSNSCKNGLSEGAVRNNFDLEDAKPVLDWKRVLKKKLEEEETIWTQRRSIAENNYAYRLEDYEQDDNKSTTEILLDTSGSISDSLLKNFLMQIKPLLKDTKIKVGCFDTRFYGFTEIKTDKDIQRLRLEGGGGTSFDVALSAFTKDEKFNKIVFTDGFSYVSENKENLRMKDVLWLVFGGADFKPCCGKVIKVDADSIMKSQKKDLSKSM